MPITSTPGYKTGDVVWIHNLHKYGKVESVSGLMVYVRPEKEAAVVAYREYEISMSYNSINSTALKFHIGQRVWMRDENYSGTISGFNTMQDEYFIRNSTGKVIKKLASELSPYSTGTVSNESRTTPATNTIILKAGDVVKPYSVDKIGTITRREGNKIYVLYDGDDTETEAYPASLKYIPKEEASKLRILAGASWYDKENNTTVYRIISLKTLVSKMRKNRPEQLKAVILHNKVTYPGTDTPNEEDWQKFNQILEKIKSQNEAG